ncbi:MAG: glycosyltransferase family 4 protein [Actinomycetia bacterium]|nr:glycosyltransferase family 4 protein [Actinomycetes bacterium]
MKIGIVCPYDWNVPSGVAIHVHELAEALIDLGLDVSVLAPGDESEEMADYVTIAGRSIPVPYNGSVARVSFGPRSASRVRKWIREGEFDVLHVHSPVTPSLGMMACWSAIGPIVATFHAAIDGRSRMMSSGAWILQATLEKVRARIAVSEEARRTVVQHLGGDAVLVPNGVDVARFASAPSRPEWSTPGSLAFLGRVDEGRKGLGVLLDALPAIAADQPEVRLLIAGPGETNALTALPAEISRRIHLLGRVTEQEKAELLSSVALFVAPHIGGESFGIVLLEAMAAGSPVLASDLVAFKDVLDGGRCGALFAAGDPASLASAATALLADPGRRAQLAAAGSERASEYDWARVARQVVAVYETVAGRGEKVQEDDRQGPGMFAGRLRGRGSSSGSPDGGSPDGASPDGASPDSAGHDPGEQR